MEKTNEIVLFETKDRVITLSVPVDQDTVWLNRNQMAELFGRDVKTIGKHINNALKEELDNLTVAKFATVKNEGGRDVERDIEHYNLDMIISVGYRVKSKRGVEFRNNYISFVAALSSDGMQIVKLYPEGKTDCRFKIRGVK